MFTSGKKIKKFLYFGVVIDSLGWVSSYNNKVLNFYEGDIIVDCKKKNQLVHRRRAMYLGQTAVSKRLVTLA